MSETARDLYGDRYPLISRYAQILATRGVEWGLIGPREVERLWQRHILNSVAITGLVPEGASVVDVGSGAGLPGIPLAILRPDLAITLVEPLLRRSTFLTQAVDELGITDRVSVNRVRAGDHHDSYGVVASRALAPLPRLVTWCAPLLAESGVILAIKGRSAGEEVAEATELLRAHSLSAAVLVARAQPLVEPTTVVRLSRV